jgi:putative DNA primase/helicase
LSNHNPNGDGHQSLSFTDLAEKAPESVLDAARFYSGLGLCVTPCDGKRAFLPDWPKRRMEMDELDRYFGDGQNVGIVLGELSRGLVNVDLDVPEAAAVARRFLPATLSSGRKSAPLVHMFYVSLDAKTMKWCDTDGAVLLEGRSTGSQSLVEPSIHPDTGERYLWSREASLEAVLIDFDELKHKCNLVATTALIARRLPPVGGRHDYAMRVIGLLRRYLDTETVCEIVTAAWRTVDADSADAIRDLEGILRDTGRRLSDGENVFGAPALDEAVPGMPALLQKWFGWAEGENGFPGPEKGSDGAPTHDELRDRWLEGQDQPVAFGLGGWRRYGQGRWVPVHDQVVYGEIDAVLEKAKTEGARPTAGARSSTERMAQAKVFVADETWDANEDILVCVNGTLEISAGALREHRPEDYALSAVPYGFDPSASAPSWLGFLSASLAGTEGFLQEFAGYCLTTDTRHELAVWLYGPPGGGKSTFIAGLQAALAPKAGLLGLADIQRSQFALADLPGKTLVVATEQPADYIKSTDVLNTVISGEAIRVEQKYKAAYTVIPRAKILWAMNDLPRVKDSNSGLFRRVKVVPVPKLRVEPDRKLKEKIGAEAPGILNWALKGLSRLRGRGHFELPGIVREATEGFKEANDVVGAFVKAACVVRDSPDCEVQAARLYEAYRHWSRLNGHRPLSSTAIAAEWRRLGFGDRSLNGRKLYTGLKVDERWLAAQDDYPKA